MAKKAKRSNPNLARQWVREHKFKALLLFIGLIWLVFLSYNKVLAWQEKKEFEKARVAIEALYVDIEKEIGKPDKTERDSSCGYGSAKFTRGFRGCSVSIKFTYDVGGPSDTTDKAERIREQTLRHFDITYSDFNIKLPFKLLSSKPEFDSSTGRYITHNEAVADLSSISTSNFLGYDRSCSLSFRYGKGDNYIVPIPNNGAQEQLVTRIGCGGGARAEHYPVR